nr:uncharacterized protein LOC117279311 [Nicotiana tomentosiformis]
MVRTHNTSTDGQGTEPPMATMARGRGRGRARSRGRGRAQSRARGASPVVEPQVDLYEEVPVQTVQVGPVQNQAPAASPVGIIQPVVAAQAGDRPAMTSEALLRFRYATKRSIGEAMSTSLELLDKRCEAAFVRSAAQKHRIERYYNQRANLRHFNVWDLVLKKVTLNTRNLNKGKLGPNWEGPYLFIEITSKGSYKLEVMNGERLPNNWNITHLKRFYC